MKIPVAEQFIRFALIGLISTIFNYGVFILLFKLADMNYLVSAGFGYAFGVLLGFFFNRSYTFRSNRRIILTLSIYGLVYLFSLAVNIFLLQFMVSYVLLDAVIANALLIPIIVVLNFIGTKIIVFRNREWLHY